MLIGHDIFFAGSGSIALSLLRRTRSITIA